MPITKFLKDKLGLLLLWLLLLGTTCLVLWLTPSVQWSWAAVTYLVVLQSVTLTAYLVLSYQKKQAWYTEIHSRETQRDFIASELTQASSGEQRISQDYTNSLIKDQRQQLEELIQTQQDQNEFIDSWVHEIKVPLAAITLLNDALETTIPEKYFYQLENDLQKIESYVDQVLYYSRLESFSQDYLIQEVGLKSLLLPLIRQNANYFIQHNLHYAIEGEDYHVLTDQKWLEFILGQLISNAIKYTPDNGSITLTLTETSEGVLLDITDTGVGIPLADQRRIFDKGFTGQLGRNELHHSTGLGLYLAKQLTEKLGHLLSVDSCEGRGTTMKLFFPHLVYYTAKKEDKLL